MSTHPKLKLPKLIMCRIKSFMLVGLLFLICVISTSEAMADTSKREVATAGMQQTYFVAMYGGRHQSEEIAIAIHNEKLPPGTKSQGEFWSVDSKAKFLYFLAPPGTVDVDGPIVIIIEKTSTGAVDLWLSGTDMARATKAEAEEDVKNFKDAGGGAFRIFQRR